MSLQVNIDDNKINNFSPDAKIELKKQINKYSDNIIKESNLIEEANREVGAEVVITSNIVLQAVRKNKIPSKKRTNKTLLIMKIISSFTLLLTGFLFDKEGYEGELTNLIIFIIILITACTTTVLQFVLEDKE
ncbi:MAG: hypothetical protein IJE16_00200 [Ruminococcus sp.]|nr:hypothetical protein [Ruminococcus sp.]